jgi:hypothetical protein
LVCWCDGTALKEVTTNLKLVLLPTMSTEIALNLERSQFEEIYFKDNNESYFNSALIKSRFRLLIATTIVYVFIAIGSQYNSIFSATLGIGTVIFGLVAASYLAKVNVIRKWRKSIHVFLDDLEKHKQFKVILSENHISFFKDEEEITDPWTSFNQFESNADYILISGNQKYFFPSKSMSKANFKTFKKVLSEKISNP